jgi:hypothetical protein
VNEALISPAYLQEQKRLHAEPRGYGQRGRKWADTVVYVARKYRCVTLLDYGCGQGSLAAALAPQLMMAEYDPAIPGKDALPDQADLVCCTDVLEHIEPDRVGAVLDHLTSLAQLVIFVVISLVETAKVLSDGRQAHINLHDVGWWIDQFAERGWGVQHEFNIKPEKQWAAVLTR